MRFVDAAILVLSRILASFGAAAVAGIFALVLAAVVMRYGVGAPFRFTEELSGLLLASTVFLTLPLTVAAHHNIRVNLLADRLHGVWRRLLWVLGQLILLAFAGVFAWQAWASTAFTLRLNLSSDVARVPLGPFMIVMTGAMMLVAAIATWQALRPPPARPKTAAADDAP
ncbi:MAG: TRAP transporter small permease [Pseudomonadota bacterium]